MVAYSSVIGNKILEHLLYAKLTIFSEQCKRLGLVFGSYLCDNVSWWSSHCVVNLYYEQYLNAKYLHLDILAYFYFCLKPMSIFLF